MNPKAKKIESIEPYKMVIVFTNNEVKEFNFTPYLHYPVYTSLKNISLFTKATVFNGTVLWDDETDFDPDTLYLESKPAVLTK